MSNCKVIALTNQKGGVGKTTTAVNLGVGLVQQGKKVLLIDADAQANLTMALGYNRPDDIPITLSTVMQNIIDDKSFDVSQGIIHHGEGIDLLPSNIELSGFEVRLINAMSRERVLKTYVNEVKKNYDYVLIDCMPSLGMITINALAAADSVIIPTQPHYLSAKGLLKLKEQQEEYKRVCGRCYNKKYLEYICVDEMGTLISPHYLTSSFPKLLEKNNLRHIRFHDLRHSCASLLLANGVPMKQIQEWLGHSDFSTTANVYAHLDYNSKLSSADAMVNGLSGALEVIS